MILEACMYTCLSIHMHTIYSGTHTDIIWHKHAYILLHPHTLACVPTDEHMSLHSCMHMSPHVSLQMHVLQTHACGEAHTCISTGTLTSSWPFLEMCVLLCRHMHTSPPYTNRHAKHETAGKHMLSHWYAPHWHMHAGWHLHTHLLAHTCPPINTCLQLRACTPADALPACSHL